MNTDELRRIKLCDLINEYKGAQQAFADEIEESASFVSQMKKGHRPIPDTVARKCEKAMKKRPFWMDIPYGEESSPELEEVLQRFPQASAERQKIILDLLRSSSSPEK